MTKTVDTPAASPRWILGSGPDRDLVVPADVDAPERVRAASDAYEAALNRYDAVGRTARDARIAVKSAPLDADAIEASRVAEVAAEAARLETRAAALDLANAIHNAKPGWIVDAQSAATVIANRAAELLVKLAGTLDQLAAERDVIEQLENWPEQGSLVGVRWVLEDRSRSAEQRAEAVESLRHATGNMSSYCQRTPTELLAALEVLIDGPVEPPQPVRRMVW